MRNFVVVVRTIINKVTPLSVFSIFVSHDDDEFEYIYLSVCRSDIITLQKKIKKKLFRYGLLTEIYNIYKYIYKISTHNNERISCKIYIYTI